MKKIVQWYLHTPLIWLNIGAFVLGCAAVLEKKLDDKFTCEQIIDSIREYNFLEISKKGYIPAYECSEIYDSLHNVFGFYNDKEIISYDQMNKIIKS